MEGPIILLLFEPEQHLPESVFVEGLIGHMFFEDQDTVERYRATFERLVDVALAPSESRLFLEQVAREWQDLAGDAGDRDR